MYFSKFAAPFLLAGLAAAAPKPQEDDPAPKPPFHIAFTFPDGTTTDVFEVPDQISDVPTNITDLVSLVFMSPPATGAFHVPSVCTFLEPDRQGLGQISFNAATSRVVDPPAVIAFVQCNTV